MRVKAQDRMRFWLIIQYELPMKNHSCVFRIEIVEKNRNLYDNIFFVYKIYRIGNYYSLKR
jgi:hypothetical protein